MIAEVLGAKQVMGAASAGIFVGSSHLNYVLCERHFLDHTPLNLITSFYGRAPFYASH